MTTPSDLAQALREHIQKMRRLADGWATSATPQQVMDSCADELETVLTLHESRAQPASATTQIPSFIEAARSLGVAQTQCDAAAIKHWEQQVQRYSAQPASVANGWQPMETAPKGGGAERTDDSEYIEPPRILIRFGDEAVSVAYWDWYYAEGGNGFRDGFAWIEPCSGEPLNLHYTTTPDGWMSLDAAPQPPAKESE